jgi:hypothetical protein
MSFMSPDVAFAEYRITQIGNQSYGDHLARINDNGKVVWYGGDVSVAEISLYEGKTTTMPTEDSIDDYVPAINDNGYVVWKGRGHNGSDLEIFIYDGTSTTNVSNNSYPDYYPQIINSGEIVWVEQPSGGGYSAVANAEASTYGEQSLSTSGSFNALALFLVPVGAVLALRFWRRRR